MLAPGRAFSESERRAIAAASFVVTPQSIGARAYAQCRALNRNVFPDYSSRFGFEGKVGNFRLFRDFGLPHPETLAYAGALDFSAAHPDHRRPPFPFPFVIKEDQGGGGNGVFRIGNPAELGAALARIGPRPLVAQRFVRHKGSDLRVVILWDRFYPYWRVQDNPEEFRNNVGRGARIAFNFEPDLTLAGVRAAADFSRRTGINCAALDILFDRASPASAPLLGEVNFVFGRKGMGGSKRFRKLFRDAVARWMKSQS